MNYSEFLKRNLPVLSLCCSSSLYIFGFFPAPFYFFLLFSVFLLIFPQYRNSYNLSFSGWLTFLGLLITMLAFRIVDSDYSVMSYYVIGFFCFFTIVGLLHTSSLTEKILCGMVTLISSTMVMTFDTIYRFLNPDFDYINAVTSHDKVDLVFYAYKHSYIFQDSNFSGLLCSILVGLSLLITSVTNYRLAKFLLIVNIVLVYFSYSRAAMFGVILYFFLYLLLFGFGKVNKFIFFAIGLIILALFVLLIPLIMASLSSLSDGSLLLKLDTFFETYETIKNGGVHQFLFGWGFNQSMNHMVRAAHNLFITIILESGFLGFIVFILFVIQYFTFNKWALISIISFITITMSFGLIISAYMVPLALIVTISSDSSLKYDDNYEY